VLKKTSPVYTLMLIALIGLTACSARFDRQTYERELIHDGENLYLENCARCHELDGGGFSDIYPNLAGNPIVTLHDPVPIIQTVLNGQGSMPAFKNSLTAEETAAILSYIRNAWEHSAPVVYPKQVQ